MAVVVIIPFARADDFATLVTSVDSGQPARTPSCKCQSFNFLVPQSSLVASILVAEASPPTGVLARGAFGASPTSSTRSSHRRIQGQRTLLQQPPTHTYAAPHAADRSNIDAAGKRRTRGNMADASRKMHHRCAIANRVEASDTSRALWLRLMPNCSV